MRETLLAGPMDVTITIRDTADAAVDLSVSDPIIMSTQTMLGSRL
jgi:hypothetical protein